MNMRLQREIFSIFTAAGLLQAAAPVMAQQSGPAGVNEARIQVTSELVLVNVVAHDKKGNLVRDLKKGDFTLLEDGKRQEISTFDFENVDELATAGAAEGTVSGVAGGALLRSGRQAAPSLNARDRRLILLFFDFSAMDPEQIDRTVDAAKRFVDTKMQPADLMALVSLATNMRVDLDFTDDKTKLQAALTAFHSGQGQGFDNGITGSAEGAAETSGAFSADDTDFNTFNADRKLLALQSLMQALGKLPQKKSLIYFSNGISQSGADNQSALRATTAAAVKANVPIYSLDIRGLQVQVNRTDLKLDFRAGYYAGRDFEHLNRADREQQLVDELDTQLPRVDVPLYAGAAYFRQDDAHYYLAVALVIPGSHIPFVTEKEKDNATIDIIGEALEGGKLRVGQLRDTVKLAVESTQQVRRKNVQYNTGFVLAPGSYHLKFIVRENQSGRMGSFETDVQIPDLRKTPLKMSSVVLSSLRAPVANKKNGANPLVRDQLELVPNITHVFAPDQHLYLQYEVYDAAKGKNPAPLGANVENRTAKPAKDSIRVFTNIEFLQGATKIYESKPVVANEVTALDRKAVIFQMDLPLEALKPGLYLCQVNVIDDVAGNFSFPCLPLLIRESGPSKPAGGGESK